MLFALFIFVLSEIATFCHFLHSFYGRPMQ